METLSALLAICAGNSPVTGEFPAQRPVTRNFDVFDLRLSKQSWGCDLRRQRAHYDAIVMTKVGFHNRDGINAYSQRIQVNEFKML